jgi:hypothetical protein
MAVPYNPYSNLSQTLNQIQQYQMQNAPVDLAPLRKYDIKPLPTKIDQFGRPMSQSTSYTPPSAGMGNIYAQAGIGALQLASDAVGMANQGLGLGQAPAPIYMTGVDPTYQTGDFISRAFSARPAGASAGEILGSAGKGAGTGASIGAMIGGGPGALIGAGIGAAAGALSSGIGGGVRKRRQTRERNRAIDIAQSQQQQFNEAQAAYNEQEAARYAYDQRRNRRMQNLFA